jgi:hypothetical protein
MQLEPVSSREFWSKQEEECENLEAVEHGGDW